MPAAISRAVARAVAVAAAAALALGALPAAASVPNAAAEATGPAALDFVAVATGLSVPTQVTAAPGVSGRLYVTELPGTVRTVDPATGAVSAAPFLDLGPEVLDGGERGLLGLLFAPDFATSGRLYVSFTLDRPATSDPDYGALVVRRVTVADPAAPVADVVASQDLITVPHPGRSNHNGGSLAWDPSGLLLVGTGDGGGGGDPDDNARRTERLLGKILRLDVSPACAQAYCIPADNPFAGGGGAPEVWLWGVRNPWRVTTDAATSSVYVADVGQGAWEEVTVVPSTASGGDLQWPCREGPAPYDPTRCAGADPRQLTPTTSTCHPSVPGCAVEDQGTSVTGGVVYRGSRYAPVLDGVYVFGDFGTGTVWTLAGTTRTAVGSLDAVTSFGTDAGGEVWATTASGTLARMEIPGYVPPPETTPPADPPATGLPAPTDPPAPTDQPIPSPVPAPSPPDAAASVGPVVVGTVRAVRAQRTAPRRVVLRWRRPADGATPSAYAVQARTPGRPWRTVAARRPPHPTTWVWRDARPRDRWLRVAATASGTPGPWSARVRIPDARRT